MRSFRYYIGIEKSGYISDRNKPFSWYLVSNYDEDYIYIKIETNKKYKLKREAVQGAKDFLKANNLTWNGEIE